MSHVPGEQPFIPKLQLRPSPPAPLAPTARPRIPIAGIGQAPPRDQSPQSIMEEITGMLYQDGAGRSLLNSEGLKDMPQWAVALMNQNRLMSIELGTFYTLLCSRGLLTPQEVAHCRRQIMAEHDAYLQKMIQQFGRQVLQQPPAQAPDPTDPRRSPG